MVIEYVFVSEFSEQNQLLQYCAHYIFRIVAPNISDFTPAFLKYGDVVFFAVKLWELLKIEKKKKNK